MLRQDKLYTMFLSPAQGGNWKNPLKFYIEETSHNVNIYKLEV